MTTKIDNYGGTNPPNAGLNHNLPENIRKAASLNGATVVAWTQLDPALGDELGRFICCRIFGPFFLPCFWPHLLILGPCLYNGKVVAENAARSQYWILTDRDLKIVSMDHDNCCCPGVIKSGDIVKSVPLENITDCGLDARGTGCVNNCAGDLPTIYIDTASSGGGCHEAVGLGLENYNWFIQKVLSQRNIVKSGGEGSMGGLQSPMPLTMARTVSDKSAQERIAEITQLRHQGILTQEEFDQKRQEIISSI